MNRLDMDMISDWMAGAIFPGIRFSLNETARISNGPHAGELVAIISIAAFEPELQYLVELSDGNDTVVKQADLRKYENTQ